MKLLRKILKSASLTTALFVFQACYGMPQDFEGLDIQISINDAESGDPIPDVSIQRRAADSDEAWFYLGSTDSMGVVNSYIFSTEIDFMFDLRLSTENGEYIQKDTVVSFNENSYRLEVKLKKAE